MSTPETEPQMECYDVDVDGCRFQRIQARTTGGGSFVIGCVDLLMESKHSASFRMLHVHEAFRRMGIGRALVAECCKIARDAGRMSIGLAVDPDNQGGQAFYHALGFYEAYRFNDGQAVWVKGLDSVGQLSTET